MRIELAAQIVSRIPPLTYFAIFSGEIIPGELLQDALDKGILEPIAASGNVDLIEEYFYRYVYQCGQFGCEDEDCIDEARLKFLDTLVKHNHVNLIFERSYHIARRHEDDMLDRWYTRDIFHMAIKYNNEDAFNRTYLDDPDAFRLAMEYNRIDMAKRLANSLVRSSVTDENLTLEQRILGSPSPLRRYLIQHYVDRGRTSRWRILQSSIRDMVWRGRYGVHTGRRLAHLGAFSRRNHGELATLYSGAYTLGCLLLLYSGICVVLKVLFVYCIYDGIFQKRN